MQSGYLGIWGASLTGTARLSAIRGRARALALGLIKLGKKLLAVGCRCLAVPSRPLTVRSRHQPLSSGLRPQAGECLHGVLHPRVGAPELVGDVVQLPIVRLGGSPVALGSDTSRVRFPRAC